MKNMLLQSENIHRHSHLANLSSFTLLENYVSNYHLKLEESLLILKLKPLTIAK